MGGRKNTHKSLSKNTNTVHPNSRRAKQQSRIDYRTAKLQAAKRVRQKGSDAKVDRISTLIFLLPPDLSYIPDLPYLHSFLQSSYLDRHSQEIQELETQKRPGRPTPAKLAQIREVINKERLEYENGMEIPDLMNEINVQLLRDWEGDRQALPLFRFIRISGKDQQLCSVIQQGLHKQLQTAKEESVPPSGTTESGAMDTSTS